MRVFIRKNLLLLIGAQLLISIVLVEAGFFDQFNKNKNKKDDKHHHQEVEKNGAPEQSQRQPKKVAKPQVDEAAELAAELAKLDEVKASVLPRRPQKFSNMLAAAKEQSRLEQASRVESEQEGEESEQQQEQEPVSKPAKVNVHNILNRVKNSNGGGSADSNEQDQQSSSSSSAGGKRVRHPVKVPIGSPNNKNGKHNDDGKSKHHHLSQALNSIGENKIMHAHFWKKGIKDAYHVTKEKVKELPAVMKDATDNIAAMLKLDSRGRLLAMIKEVEDDISFVRREFSSFSLTWSAAMDKSLTYIGTDDLNHLNCKGKDELDFRHDALIAATFGYEFMRLMMAWRENLMIGHQAYKEYLQQVLLDLEKEHFEVKEDFIYQLETIHNYILLNCWMEIDNLAIESKMKLDFLMEMNDKRPKNYESEYFRQIIVLQEIYDPTSEEFKQEREQVVNALSESGQNDDSFNDVDDFFADFKNNLVADENNTDNKQNKIDWEVPQELVDFMNMLQPGLRFNSVIYQKSFLKDLKEAKEKAMSEMYGQQ